MSRTSKTPRSLDRQPHDVLAEAALALARPLSTDRVLDEIGRQLQRAMHGVAVAIAIAEAGDVDSLVLAHQAGFEGDHASLARRFADDWRRALESRGVVTSEATPRELTLTAPIAAEGLLLGAITVTVDKPESDGAAAELARILAGVGAHAAAALDRAAAVRRLEHRRRVTTVDEMSVGLAHELRNRLFGISSAAQLLRFRVTEDPAVEKNVGRILREVERMNNTVNALLEFGQPVPARLVPGDPDAVWDDVLEQQRGHFESKALKLVRTRAAPRASCPIDAGRLASALTHLLVNATDAAPEGTDLSLESSVLPDGSWRCRLANGGPTLGPETRRRAFDLFFTTKETGTGMGLPLCQRIIDDHGGSLSLESADETGTIVTVTLPGAG